MRLCDLRTATLGPAAQIDAPGAAVGATSPFTMASAKDHFPPKRTLGGTGSNAGPCSSADNVEPERSQSGDIPDWRVRFSAFVLRGLISPSMAKTSTFSLYLVKPDVTAFDEVLTETARAKLEQGHAHRAASDEFGDGAILYTFPGYSSVPRWVGPLREVFELQDNLYAQSPSAVLVFRKGGSLYALTFSYGHVYLNDAKLEAEFGLKVAINSMGDQRIKSIERSNIGAAIRDYAQAARQRDLRSFGFDDALDLIRKISGYAEDEEFADRLTGSRALRFSKKIDITAVPDLAVDALALFGSTAYRDTAFKIIDFLSPVLDSTIGARLDAALVAAIRGGTDEFEISIPEIIPDGMASFRFEHAGFTNFHADLSLELYRAGLDARLGNLALDDLKKHTVAAYGENEDRPSQHWSVHHALVGSLVLDGERYALNEGYWYRVDESFKATADANFVRLCGPPDRQLRPLRKIIQPGRKTKAQKTLYQSEESYTAEVAQETGYLLLDQKLIHIDDVAGPGMEACDLLDMAGRRFIHVKKSSRQSSVLSHLFKQGGNAAQMLRKYEAFRAGLVAVVRREYGDQLADELEAALRERWTVEFQIADFPREDGQHNIPFFSKLTLREEARNIEAMDFSVRVAFITLARD
jgi:uncharacterized protein (TIGR04141 family)